MMLSRFLLKHSPAAASMQQRSAVLGAAAASTSRPQFFMVPKTRQEFSHFARKNKSGLQPPEFDYYFESKINRGNFPDSFQSYMKVLGTEYDTQSE